MVFFLPLRYVQSYFHQRLVSPSLFFVCPTLILALRSGLCGLKTVRLNFFLFIEWIRWGEGWRRKKGKGKRERDDVDDDGLHRVCGRGGERWVFYWKCWKVLRILVRLVFFFFLE